MKFTLKIKMDNSAFNPDWNYEAVRILKEVAYKVENGQISGNILDINGNSVGKFFATKGK